MSAAAAVAAALLAAAVAAWASSSRGAVAKKFRLRIKSAAFAATKVCCPLLKWSKATVMARKAFNKRVLSGWSGGCRLSAAKVPIQSPLLPVTSADALPSGRLPWSDAAIALSTAFSSTWDSLKAVMEALASVHFFKVRVTDPLSSADVTTNTCPLVVVRACLNSATNSVLCSSRASRVRGSVLLLLPPAPLLLASRAARAADTRFASSPRI